MLWRKNVHMVCLQYTFLRLCSHSITIILSWMKLMSVANIFLPYRLLAIHRHSTVASLKTGQPSKESFCFWLMSATCRQQRCHLEGKCKMDTRWSRGGEFVYLMLMLRMWDNGKLSHSLFGQICLLMDGREEWPSIPDDHSRDLRRLRFYC